MESNRSNVGAARSVRLSAAVCIAFALGACTTLGTGTGFTSPGDKPVSFAWNSKNGGVTGTMSATLPEGVFTGPYLEITSTSQSTQFMPMWEGWEPYWSGWGWGVDLNSTTTNYTGKVVANLRGPGAKRMRCRFDLNKPYSGMDGGGQGKCQVAGGETVDAVFPRA